MLADPSVRNVANWIKLGSVDTFEAATTFDYDHPLSQWIASTGLATELFGVYPGLGGTSVVNPSGLGEALSPNLPTYGYVWVDDSLSNISGSRKAFGPTNEGPLKLDVANTFRGGAYTEIQLSDDLHIYRVYGGSAGEIGHYWTTQQPQGPLQSVIDSALDQSWGNTATEVSIALVPKGTSIYIGYAEHQGGLVGGGIQVYVEEFNPSWIIK
jgi:hypothetical protein